MKKKFRLIILAILAVSLSLTAACTGNETSSSIDKSDADMSEISDFVSEESPSESVSADGTTDEEYFSAFVPILRFTVTSDVHMSSSSTQDRFKKVLADMYTHAENGGSYTALDGIMVVGDLSNSGYEGSTDEWVTFYNILNPALKEGTEKLVTIGNHDVYEAEGDGTTRYTDITGEEAKFHKVINGYHFIGFSPTIKKNSYGEEIVKWVDEQLSIAAADTPNKPIFVCQHHPVSNTVYGSQDFGVKDFEEVFKKYPQIIDFSGHTHYPLSDPRTIWQGDFTALGTSTLDYYSIGVNGVSMGDFYPNGTDGAFLSYPTGNSGHGEYYMVEADANGAVVVTGYSLYAEEPVCRYYLRTPWDKSTFTYGSNRVKASPRPVFGESAEAVVDSITSTSLSIKIPQATVTEGVVESYRADIKLGRQIITRAYSISNYFIHPMPENVIMKAEGLTPETEYSVNIYAVNAFGIECEKPLVIKVTTPSPEIPEDPTVDIVGLGFIRGEAVDYVSNLPFKKVGTPVVNEINKLSVIFDGSSGLIVGGFQKHYEALAKSFTAEAHFKADSLDGSTSAILSNQEEGGLGIEIRGDSVGISAFINGQNVFHGGKIKAGEYVHFIAVFDGKKLCAYINGELVSSGEYEGGIQLPTGAKYLVIGGDSNAEGTVSSGFKGSIAAANIYSRPMDAEFVRETYEKTLS